MAKNKTKWLYANPLPEEDKYENATKRYELFIEELKTNLNRMIDEPIDEETNLDDIQEVLNFLEEDNRLLIGKRNWITESYSSKKETKDILYFVIIGTKKDQDLQYIYSNVVGELLSLIRHYDNLIELYNNIVESKTCPDIDTMIQNAFEYATAVETGLYEKMVATAKYMKSYYADGFEKYNMGKYLNYDSLENYLDTVGITDYKSNQSDDLLEELVNSDSTNQYVKKVLSHYRMNCSVNLVETKTDTTKQTEKETQQTKQTKKRKTSDGTFDISNTQLGKRMIELGVDPNDDFADFKLYEAEGKELERKAKDKQSKNQEENVNQEEN